MEVLNQTRKFYLDKEKDIIVSLFETGPDELTYLLETPNHKTGNLITNLARVCGLETIKDEHDMKVITGKMYATINSDNEEVYIFRLGGIKVANIYHDRIEIKAQISAICKTLMSQTKRYNYPVEKTLVKTYILKQCKFRTDLHTHMNANLTPDCLIALGLKHQIQYPLYYIKKLGLILSGKQESEIFSMRKQIEKQYSDCSLTGKYLERKIDDNTFINFADFIFNNLENAEKNIEKIRNSLSIMKDGQAVFTNLEKCYIYRYVFAKGIPCKNKIEISNDMINSLPENDIRNILFKMIDDVTVGSPYINNTLRQDKFLWIAREYKKQGTFYVEITDTDLVKVGLPSALFLEEVHSIMPEIEKETGVKIRFLAGIRRIVLTIIKDQKTSNKYLREGLCVLKAVSKSPYVVGSDFIGEEINDIEDLKPAIKELVQNIAYYDKGFTIRIHAGENDSLKDNVAKSIRCVEESLRPGQIIPRIRIGHGLYSYGPDTKAGKDLIKTMKDNNVIVEFQLTSNIRLNNLSGLTSHPLPRFISEGVSCVQGTDGKGMYGTDTFDEQLALQNLLGLTNEDFMKMRKVEDELIAKNNELFEQKSMSFDLFLNGRSIRDAILELENFELDKIKNLDGDLRVGNSIEAESALQEKIYDLPLNKIPVVIAGGSFNKKGRKTIVERDGEKIIRDLVENLDPNKFYFVIGHSLDGYEKLVVDMVQSLDKPFDIFAIVPKVLSDSVKDGLKSDFITGIRISTESEELGIYKSFNYEIFERRKSIVIAFDGNSPVSNLVQEAKNGKGHAQIFVNIENEVLQEKVHSLAGYVLPFALGERLVDRIDI